MDRLQALKYLAENSVACNEWSGAGMCDILIEIIMESEDKDYTKKELDDLLERASNY